MPITLQQLAAHSASVTFEFAGESVTVRYAPDRVTEHLQAQIQTCAALPTNEQEVSTALTLVNETLVTLVLHWDVLESEGGPMVPIDAEHVATLPFSFRVEVLKRIFEDMAPGEAPGGAPKRRSAATSPRKAK
jgi:1-deoxy-D-xylulose 5-phosphate reductoisomerase